MVRDIVKEKGYLTLGSRMRRIGERLQAETQQLMARHGVDIPAAHYPLLAALDEQGALSVNEIAQTLGVKQPGVTRSIRLLEAQGIVRVRKSETDLRSREVSLSEAGQGIVTHGRQAVWPLIAASLAEIMAGSSGSLLADLDHLEAGLDDASFEKRASKMTEGGDE